MKFGNGAYLFEPDVRPFNVLSYVLCTCALSDPIGWQIRIDPFIVEPTFNLPKNNPFYGGLNP